MKTSKKLLAFLLSAVMVLSLVVSVSVVASASADGTELYRFEVTEDSTEASVAGCLTTTHFYDATNKVFKQTSLTQEIATDAVYGNVWHATLDKGYSGLASLKDENKKATGYDKNGDPTIADTAGVVVFAQKDGITYKAGNKYVLKVRAKATDEFPLSFFFFIGTSKKIQTVENSKFANVTYPRNYKTFSGNEWVDYEFEFTIKGFTNAAGDVSYTEHTGGQLRLEFNSVSKAQDIYIDSVILTEYEPASGSAVFTIDEGVTVKNGDAIINSGESAKEAYYGAGVPTTFTATVSDSSKSATVTVDGKKWLTRTGSFEFTIPEDAKAVSVTLNDEKIIYGNYFNRGSADDIVSIYGLSKDIYVEGTKTPAVAWDVVDGCLLGEFQGMPASGKYPEGNSNRLFNLSTGAKLQPGHKYKFIIKAKASEPGVKSRIQCGSRVMAAEYKTGYIQSNSINVLVSDEEMTPIQHTQTYYGTVDTTNNIFKADQQSIGFTFAFGMKFANSATDAKRVANTTDPNEMFNGDEKVWIDEIEIIDLGKDLSTVSIRVDSEGGKLTRKYYFSKKVNGVAVTEWFGDIAVGAAAYSSATGSEMLTFKVTPDEGKVAVVKYYDVVKTIKVGDDDEVAFKADKGDTTLDVTFVDATKTAAVEKTTMLRTADNAVYVYSIINQFNPALDANQNLNFGIKLWNAVNADRFVILNAKADNDGNDAVAQFGQAFVIKAYGEAITADNTYEAQAFVGTEYGEVVSTATATEEN